MSQSQYNQVVAVSANTVKNVSVPLYYARVICTNQTADPIYVSTNGSPVGDTGDGEFGAVVMPSAWRTVGNDQPAEPQVSKTSPGSTVQNTGYQGVTFPNLNPLASGSPTYVSILGAAAGNVVLEFV
jgi:hypothetical protein